uniref:C2H2-type domain-containing protein n=1 Tax=viral metagenome TaxID=1070528 RepID=A0A6C0KGF8_9ZZZZ
MVTKTEQKRAHTFVCNYCDYKSSRKNNFERHLLTLRHHNYSKGDELVTSKGASHICQNCNKIYQSRNGLWKHEKNCIIKKQNEEQINKLTEIVVSQQEQLSEFHNTITTIMTNNEKRDEIFMELAKKPSMNNSMNMINSNNKNYHIYLNTHCANAIDFPDFLNNLNITMDDLFYSKDNGYTKAITNIFQKNLSILDKTERPIYCSDKKRMNFYVKDGKWKKDNENKKILEGIWKVTHKQIKYMNEWRKANPNWRENEEKDLEFLNIVRNIMGGASDEEQCKNKAKIIKELALNNDIKELFSEE